MVQKKGEHYKCDICDNEVIVTLVGGGPLCCCGQPMMLLDTWVVTADEVKKPKKSTKK